MLRFFEVLAFWGVSFFVTFVGDGVEATKPRSFVNVIAVYHECKAWEAVLRRAETGILQGVTKSDEKLISNINGVCGQLDEILKEMQTNLDNYKDYYNTVMRSDDPAVKEKTRIVRDAYRAARKEYISLFPKAASPYTPCAS